MARAQSSAKGRFAKQVVEIPLSGGIMFTNYSAANNLVTANSTGLKVRGKVYPGGQNSLSVTANTTTFTISGGLAVSGKLPTITGNTTGHILSGKLYVSGVTTRNIGANSTCFLFTTVSALPNTRQRGGISYFANTTGCSLIVNTTGTTWKYLKLTGTAPA